MPLPTDVTLAAELPPLELHPQTRRGRAVKSSNAIGAPRAEIISRLWQAIAFLEEVRADIPRQVRASESLGSAVTEIQAATRRLTKAAALLAPHDE